MWAVRRSLRLLTLLTLMASALCNGQSLAAQDISTPRVTVAEVSQPPSRDLVAATEIFAGDSAVTLASAISPVGVTSGPAHACTAALFFAPTTPAPLIHAFSPLAERAPPAV